MPLVILASLPAAVTVTNLTTEDLYILDLRVAVGTPRVITLAGLPYLRQTQLWDAIQPPLLAGLIGATSAASVLTDGVHDDDRVPFIRASLLADVPTPDLTIVNTTAEDIFIGTKLRVPALDSLVVPTTVIAEDPNKSKTDLWYDLLRAIRAGSVTVAGIVDPEQLLDGVESGKRESGDQLLDPASFAGFVPAPVGSTWNVNAAGNWNTAANWNPSLVPGGSAAAVTLGSVITAPRTVTLTTPVTINNLTINASFAYTLAGSALTVPTISVAGTGTPTISAPLVGTAGLAVTNAPAATISGAISGTTLTKAGVGTLTLTGANTYSGTTTISAGTLVVGASGTLPTTTIVTGAGTLDVSGFNTTIGNLTGTIAVTLGVRTLVVGDATNTTYDGVITGTGAVTKQGAGTWTLNAIQAYTGTTTINAGTIKMGAANVMPTTDISFADVASATLDLNGFNETMQSVYGGGSTGGTITSTGGPCTFTFGDNDNDAFAGRIRDGLNVVKVGTGAYTLSGANDFTGTMAINVGSIIAGANNVIPSTCAITTANTAGVALTLTGTTQSFASIAGGGSTGGGMAIGGATINLTGASNTSYAGVISGAGAVINKSGAGTLTLSATNTCTGTLNIANGSAIQVGSATAMSTMTVVPADGATLKKATGTLTMTTVTPMTWPNGGTVNWVGITGTWTWGTGACALTGHVTHNIAETGTTVLFTGVISGTGNITKTGAGTLQFNTATNTFVGNVYVNSGSFFASNVNSIPAGSTVYIGDTSGSADVIGNFVTAFARAINVRAGSSGVATIKAITTTSTIASAITINKSVILRSGGTAVTFTGGITGTGNVSYPHDSAASCTFSTVAVNNTGQFSTTNNFNTTSTITFTLGLGANVTNVTFGSTAIHVVTGTMLNTGTFALTAGTLRGAGTVKGTSITMSSGTTCYGGTGTGNAGTLTCNGPTTLSTGALYVVNVGSTTTVSKISVTGNLTLNSNATSFQVAALNAGTYLIMACTGTITGTLANPSTVPTGRTFSNYTYVNGVGVSVVFT